MQSTIIRAFKNAGGEKISRDLKALYIHRVLLRIAFGIATVFTVALIYQYFNDSFLAVALVYSAIQALVFFLTPLSSKWLRRLGIRSMILIAVPLVTLGTVGLYNFSKGGENALYGLGAFVVLMAAYKIMYWVPYQVDVSLLLDRKHRGRQVALLRNASDLVIVSTPFVGGLIIASFGFSTMYLISIASSFSRQATSRINGATLKHCRNYLNLETEI
jgi:MFS family permease